MTTGAAAAAASSADQSPMKKKGWPKGKKRRLLPKDNNAPKGPLSGYMLFMGDQRESIRSSNPAISFPDITKMVAQKWAVLETTEKQKYLDSAEAEKERYQRELEIYQKSDAYKQFIEKQLKEDTIEEEKISTPKEDVVEVEEEELLSLNNNSAFEIPIFTSEFLHHNKRRESELKELRKSTTDYEEQNAILQKHIDCIRVKISKLESETLLNEKNNEDLNNHINNLRKKSIEAFASITLPDTGEAPNEENIDEYLSKLHALVTADPPLHAKLALNVKTIVNQMNLS